MAITAEQRIDALYDIVATFEIVPGAGNFSSIVPDLNQGATREQLVGAFVANPAFGTLYPVFQTTEEFANAWLAHLFDGTVTGALFDEAVNVVVGALNSGTSIPSLIIQAVDYLRNTSDPGYNSAFADASAILANKVAIAEHHSIVLGLDVESPEGSTLGEILQDHRDVLLNVTADPQSVTDVKTQLDTIAAAGDPITLTPQQDTVVGSTANDSIFGFINDVVELGNTLNSGDTIDGGLGQDTLFVTIEDTSDNDLNLNMINVEKMEIRDFDGQTFEMESVTGLNTISLVGGDDEDTSFDDGTYIVPNIEFHNVEGEINQDAGIVSVIPMLNVLLDNASAEVYTYSDNTADRANYSAATITSTGAGWNSGENYLYLGESQGAQTVNIMGDTDLYLDIEHFNNPTGTGGSIDLIDASGLDADLMMDVDFEGIGETKSYIGAQGNDTIDDNSDDEGQDISYATGDGNDSIDILGGGATNDYTIDAGTGNDTVMVDDDNITGDTIDGGDDTDTLSINEAMVAAVNLLTTAQKAALNAAITNFESLVVRDALASDIDVVDFGGIQSLTLAGGATGAPNLVEGLATGGTLNIGGTSTSITVDMDGAGAGSADELNLGISAAVGGIVTAADIETINISATGASAAATLVAVDTKTINVSGSGDLNLTNTGNGDVILFDGSASSGDLVFVSDNTGDSVTLLGGSGDDTLDANVTGATKTTTIDGGDGDDIIVGSTAGVNTLSGGEDDDTITGGALADTIDGGDDDDIITGGLSGDSLTGGDGDDSFVYTAALESNGVNVDDISDFTSGDDVINTNALTGGIGAYLGEANGYGAVLTSLSGSLTAEAVLDTSTSTLYIDVDGNGILDNADLTIDLTGVTDLAGTDIVF